MTPTATVHYGLGPIGLGIAGVALDRGYRPAGAVDIDPQKAGRDLGTLLGRSPLGVTVTAEARAALASGARVVLHSTQSRLAQVLPQIMECVEAGACVISTCEELAFPWRQHPGDARRIDDAAKARGVAVVGVGVNPGFVMDLLPIALMAPCRTVRAVHVTRVVDAGLRRLPLQRKVGAGLDPEAFEAGVAAGRIGHIGLPESVAMIADALGWPLEAITETIEPVRDGAAVRGLHQVAVGVRDGRPVITLDLTMALGAPNPRDAVVIEGDPPISMAIAGGVHGDVATCAIAVNAIPQVLAAPPGLVTVHRLPPIHP
ncbi:MAG: dihydrodipicolinate reductase [Armatimonadota bacterium]|nr:dihydrodipicolinate reductase [Armatimonadota bacterium]